MCDIPVPKLCVYYDIETVDERGDQCSCIAESWLGSYGLDMMKPGMRQWL